MTAPATFKIALAQLNPVVGDLGGNAKKALAAHVIAKAAAADLLVLPELFLNGYPPEDLVLKPAFQSASRTALYDLAVACADGPAILIGTIWHDDGKLYNAVALLDGGKIDAVRFKVELPNYGVFDEARVFSPGPMPGPLNVRGVRVGVPICEDIWGQDVVETLVETGAEILISPNGSPFDWPKPDRRMNVAVARVTESRLPLVYLNQVGGQDELVFDGASFVLNADRSLAAQLPAWREAIVMTDWTRGVHGWHCARSGIAALPEGDASAYHACVLGLRDYVHKNGFPGVVLGLSGGIDSALVAAIAVDALGPDKVHAIMLPSKFTSDESLLDAAACAKALGIRYDKISIEPAVAGLTWGLKDLFAGSNTDTTEENMQSRVRGTLLMAISNKFGSMLVTTGNKSEMSVGYATIYGDMNGGFNPIKDLYKMEVYRLSHWRNGHVPDGGHGRAAVVIPKRILTKAPTAELRPDQTDQDSLPPYAALDDILRGLVEDELPVAALIARGHPPETVKKIERLLYLAEYKRRQAAPGVKISPKNFGRDRRYPITNKFRDNVVGEPASLRPPGPASVKPRTSGSDNA
ncbi:MAG: NAD+ synthase [Hyphomicrobium sp.]|nr:NAD+ synthase [Hyphomicrobium sp.]